MTATFPENIPAIIDPDQPRTRLGTYEHIPRQRDKRISEREFDIPRRAVVTATPRVPIMITGRRPTMSSHVLKIIENWDR